MTARPLSPGDIEAPVGGVVDTLSLPRRASGWILVMRDRLETWPTWAVLLGFFALTRLLTAGLIEATAVWLQNPAGVGTLSPGYADMVGVWDGRWYAQIVNHGYPSGLPVDPDTGVVTYSAWAFYPAFPLAVRALVSIGIPFTGAAVGLNLVLSAASVLLIWKLLSSAAQTVLHRRMALLATMLWCLYPATAILQVAYSEALAALLLAAFLLLLIRRCYVFATLMVVALGFTRAVAPPLAVVVLVHMVLRWRSERSAGLPPLGDQRRSGALLVVATGVSAISWPLWVGVSTGTLEGFFQVQAAWGQRPDKGLFLAWVTWAWHYQGLAGVLLLFGIVASYVSLVMGRHGAFMALEVRAWALAYPIYLLAVLRPITSMWRFLLLDFPLAAVLVSLAVRGADGGRVTAGWPRRLAVTVLALVVGVAVWTGMLMTYVPWAGKPP